MWRSGKHICGPNAHPYLTVTRLQENLGYYTTADATPCILAATLSTGMQEHLGYYTTAEEAALCYARACPEGCRDDGPGQC